MDTAARESDGAPPARLIGPHLPSAAGLIKTATRAEQIGATAIQIFTDNPTAWRRRTQPPRDLAAFRQRLREAGIGPLAIHAPYLVNLCGPSEDFWRKSVATMAHELAVGAQCGAAFVVMHIGSHRGLERGTGISRLVDGMRAVLAQAAEQQDGASPGDALPLLALENAAGTGDGIGSSLEDLADILAAADAGGVELDRLTICLDTAHLWGAGHDLGDDNGVERLVGRIDELIGRHRVALLHLNDSRVELGARLDRHEHIGAGKLGAGGLTGMLNHPWLKTLPTYLETPGMDVGYDQINLERALRLAANEALPELPPEAFEMRRSRAR